MRRAPRSRIAAARFGKMRDFAQAQGWEVAGEFVDHAPARDLAHRVAWRRLLSDGARKRFALFLVFKLDRAFRSVKDMHDTLAVWEVQGIGFQSVREGFDTRTAIGRFLLNLLASLAEFELELIRERVKAGMDRARREGRHIGRPRVSVPPAKLDRIRTQIAAGEISRRRAAAALGIGDATLRRLLT